MLQLRNKSTDSLNLEGYTVVIPSICVGNAAQLACDLLISSKELRRIGSISHPALIPIYGPSAFQHEPKEKAASCELYESAEDKLLVVQFRTPLISRHAPSLHAYLAELVHKAKAHRVVILSGSFGFEKRIIESSPYEYRVSESFKNLHTERLQKMPWKEFTGEMIFGGGNCLQLFQAIEKENVPVMLLFRYLLEGDNSSDAASIVRELNELCEHFLEIPGQEGGLKLTVPVSWKLLFGNDVPELIFNM